MEAISSLRPLTTCRSPAGTIAAIQALRQLSAARVNRRRTRGVAHRRHRPHRKTSDQLARLTVTLEPVATGEAKRRRLRRRSSSGRCRRCPSREHSLRDIVNPANTWAMVQIYRNGPHHVEQPPPKLPPPMSQARCRRLAHVVAAACMSSKSSSRVRCRKTGHHSVNRRRPPSGSTHHEQRSQFGPHPCTATRLVVFRLRASLRGFCPPVAFRPCREHKNSHTASRIWSCGSIVGTLGQPHAHRNTSRLARIPIEPAAPVQPNLPRLRALALLERRPTVLASRPSMPASEKAAHDLTSSKFRRTGNLRYDAGRFSSPA
jgi:hypothetical protein